jgi:hypothetical protein
MALKKSELYSSLWSGCDELRGGMRAMTTVDHLPPCPAIAPPARRRKLTGEVATLAAEVDADLRKMEAQS